MMRAMPMNRSIKRIKNVPKNASRSAPASGVWLGRISTIGRGCRGRHHSVVLRTGKAEGKLLRLFLPNLRETLQRIREQLQARSQLTRAVRKCWGDHGAGGAYSCI